MPSKLDYLSKYTSSTTGDDENEKRKRKKEKKKKKRKHDGSKSRSLTSNLVDEDDFAVKGGSDNDGFDMDDDDDGPVVVNGNVAALEDDIQASGPRGVWKTVANTAGDNTIGSTSAQSGKDRTLSGTVSRRRHDSTSSSEGERIRPRQRQDSSNDGGNRSDNFRRRRYDSSDEEEESSRGRSNRRQPHDSSSEDETNRRASNPRARRHDSDDENSVGRTRQQKHRRQRHDSSDEEDRRSNRKRRRRCDSSDEDKRRPSRKRHDSSYEDEGRDETRKRQLKRHDSSDDSDNGRRRPRRRERYDSEESDTDRKTDQTRKRHDSDDDDDASSDGSKGEARMSSGHKAGLQHYHDFNKSERKIQAKKHRDAQRMVDKHGMGETVYRDKDGRKTQAEPDGRNQVDAAAAAERLNQGRVQQEARDAKTRELIDLQNSGFARYRDDDRLEEQLKNEIRKDDPMARYAISKQQRQSKRNASGSSGGQPQAPSKPIYKGPPPKPNRFGIRPGYRWDGNDRGNGFEDKILAKKYSRDRKAEQSYKWSSADM